jgi:hypothetical protein
MAAARRRAFPRIQSGTATKSEPDGQSEPDEHCLRPPPAYRGTLCLWDFISWFPAFLRAPDCRVRAGRAVSRNQSGTATNHLRPPPAYRGTGNSGQDEEMSGWVREMSFLSREIATLTKEIAASALEIANLDQEMGNLLWRRRRFARSPSGRRPSRHFVEKQTPIRRRTPPPVEMSPPPVEMSPPSVEMSPPPVEMNPPVRHRTPAAVEIYPPVRRRTPAPVESEKA